MDTETQEVESNELPEFDLSFETQEEPDSAEPGEELEAGAEEEEEPAEAAGEEAEEGTEEEELEAAPEGPAPIEARDLLERTQRKMAELEAHIQRLTKAGFSEPTDDKPPKPLDQLSTAQDVIEYVNWQRNQDAKLLRAQAQAEGMAAASEQRARGLLSDQALGRGYGYDAVISRHVEPLEQSNPALRAAIASFSDPAVARYTLGFIMELQEKLGGDPVKVFKEIRGAMGARSSGAKELMNKIKKAETTGAAKIRAQASRPGKTPGGKIGAREIDSMSDAEFVKLRQKLYGNG